MTIYSKTNTREICFNQNDRLGKPTFYHINDNCYTLVPNCGQSKNYVILTKSIFQTFKNRKIKIVSKYDAIFSIGHNLAPKRGISNTSGWHILCLFLRQLPDDNE
jgi:hypothetical protein